MNQLENLYNEIFGGTELKRAVFSAKRRKSLEYDRVTLRPVMVGGQYMFQAEYSYPKKAVHRNLSSPDAKALAAGLIAGEFKQINILTGKEEIQVLANKPEDPRILRKAILMKQVTGSGGVSSMRASAQLSSKLEEAGSVPAPSHNRRKNYVIPEGVPCDFLIRLGVMGEDGKVFPRAYSKFRQINRYLEIVENAYPALERPGESRERPVRVIDFGCGKAYLTFALYHYLKVLKGRNVEIVGLDLKEDVIQFCSAAARDLGYEGLVFLRGDIADYTEDHADMVVTLHACDTATDYALINAVNWGTKVILSVPCCQHELFRQIKNDIHEPMLKHGILKDRLTEYLTDGLRALKLEEKGYSVELIEFTSLEHTARNIMISAVKNGENPVRMAKAKAEYERLCGFYQVKPTIDKM